MDKISSRARASILKTAFTKLEILRDSRSWGWHIAPSDRAEVLANVAKLRMILWTDMRPICMYCWKPADRRERLNDVDTAWCNRCWRHTGSLWRQRQRSGK